MKMQTIPLQTTRIRAAADLAPFLDDWRRVTAGAPMRSPEWLLGWWDVYAAPGDELCVLLFHEPQGVLIGLAPLYLQSAGADGLFRLLGSGEVGTNHTTWFAVRGWEARVGVEVGCFLLGSKSEWSRLLLESVDAADPAIQETLNILSENGCFLSRRPNPNCWSIALPATWEEYLQKLSKSLRKRCRKLQRQFLDSGKIQVRQVSSIAELSQGFEILLKLHSARWGTSKHPGGVFGDLNFRKFHEKFSEKLLFRRQLRLAWLECEGKPIAVEYQFVDNQAVYAYQAGVDLSMDQYAPGKVSMMAAIQFAIARGCRSFDLLRGDEPYKSNWRAMPAGCHDVRVWQDGIRARAEWLFWELVAFAVRQLKPRMSPRLIKCIRRLIPR